MRVARVANLSKTCNCKWYCELFHLQRKQWQRKFSNDLNKKCTEPFPTQLRTCVRLRRTPGLLPCASWSAGYESLPTIGSKSCSLWLQDTIDDGRRILCARVQHGEPLVISASLRNGSSASLCNCNSKRVQQLSRTPDTKKSCQQLSKQHPKTINEPLWTTSLFSPTAKLDHNLWASVCGRRQPHNLRATPTTNKHDQKNGKQHLTCDPACDLKMNPSEIAEGPNCEPELYPVVSTHWPTLRPSATCAQCLWNWWTQYHRITNNETAGSNHVRVTLRHWIETCGSPAFAINEGYVHTQRSTNPHGVNPTTVKFPPLPGKLSKCPHSSSKPHNICEMSSVHRIPYSKSICWLGNVLAKPRFPTSSKWLHHIASDIR